ncbi:MULTISPECIES: ATP-binding protein [unclassified Microbulbifer]|uniref:ATP-binding protein n=1 Tax=unclassified Microbulbifer TaxID=2619833 RepID=UPI0027E51D8D|nr:MULTISPECIES: ATP-binding protein [unclassified Microbulbifer]
MLKKISHKLMATILGVTLIAAAAIYASGYLAVRSGLGGITEQLHRRHLDSNMLESMGEEIHQLNTLINDLRTLTQSDLGGLSFQRERIPARRFFDDYAHKAAGQLEPHGLSLEPDIELDEKLSLFADKSRLKQLLDNLLQNSRRYTDADGKVQLSLYQDERELVLCWQDSAPGVPAESLPKLFERLYRVESSRNRATGGSGLGLSICKSIVEAQNGVIEAGHSELGGLAITCRLPLMT